MFGGCRYRLFGRHVHQWLFLDQRTIYRFARPERNPVYGYGGREEAVHDRRRQLRSGGGTHAKIIGNLKELSSVDRPFVLDVRVNFDEDNVEDVPDLLKSYPTYSAEMRDSNCLSDPLDDGEDRKTIRSPYAIEWLRILIYGN